MDIYLLLVNVVDSTSAATPLRATSTPKSYSTHRTPISRTPYARTANRRYNVLTPGRDRDRRRSGIQQRKLTPRDDLRLLSRILKRPLTNKHDESRLGNRKDSAASSRSSTSVLDRNSLVSARESIALESIASYKNSDDEQEERIELDNTRISLMNEDEQDMSIELPRRLTLEPRLSMDRNRVSVGGGQEFDETSLPFVIRPPEDETLL